MEDLELEALQKRLQQRMLAGQLQDSSNPNAELGLNLAGGALDLFSRNAQAGQDIASMATGIKGPNQAGPSTQSAVQAALNARHTRTRQAALDDQNSVGAIQRLIDAKRAKEDKLRGEKRANYLAGLQEGEDGELSLVEGGATDLSRKSTMAAIKKAEAEAAALPGQRDLERRYKEAQIQALGAKASKGGAVDGINREYFVPEVGEALTKLDAKDLKDAIVAKKSFDADIQEMIDLRQKYGGEVMNRTAVARGQQLSKKLLLNYKNLQKLGVLSQSDEAIVNAIIPSDPLQFTSPVGKDPILSNLQSFKSDMQKDYDNNVKARLKQPLNSAQPGYTDGSDGPPRKILSDEDAEAISWASENPNNPDAQAILKLHRLL